MKNAALFLFLPFTLTLSAQQSDIKGVVSIHNSQFKTGTRQYVQNAQVEDDFGKANAQITDATGKFTLIFVEKDKGKSVVLSIKKAGLQVVNTPDLTAVTGQTDALKISMAHPDSIAEYRKRLYNIGKSEAEKNLYAQLKKKGAAIESLQKDAQKNAAAIEKLQKEYADLDKYAKNIEEQAQDLARRYAPINLDDAAPLYREAFGYFQQGDLEKAMQILRGADLIGQADKILAERKAIGTIRQEANQRDSLQQQRTKDLLQVLGLKADLHEARFEWDSVRVCLELRVSLDSTNVDNLGKLAKFFGFLNQQDSAIFYYEKALAQNSNDIITATLLSNVSGLYEMVQDSTKAIDALQKSLIIRRDLFKKDSSFALPLAETLHNFGGHYWRQHNFILADTMYREAIKIKKSLLNKFLTDSIRYSLSTTLVNLGLLYSDKRDTTNSFSFIREALIIVRSLIISNPKIYEPQCVMLLHDIGAIYHDNTLTKNAENLYVEALDIYKKLIKTNAQRYEPDMANTLQNLGNIYSDNDTLRAKEKYKEALIIFEKFAKNNRLAYEPSIARIYYNIGFMYIQTKNWQQADSAMNVALTIKAKLASIYPSKFEIESLNTRCLLIEINIERFLELKAENEKQNIINKIDTLSNSVYSKYIGKTDFPIEYSEIFGNIAWYEIFVKRFDFSEAIARQGLIINPNQLFCKMNKAIALLFQNKDDEAKKLILELKSQPYEEGKTFGEKFIEGFTALEQAGLDKTQLDKARQWIKD
jgi:hypothetical protein